MRSRAEIYQTISDAFAELAELAELETGKAEERPSEPRRRPRAEAFPAPRGIATDVDVARAKKMLRGR